MIKARKFERNLPHADIIMIPEGGDVRITGNLIVSGTMTAGGVVDGGGAVTIQDDLTVEGTSQDPLFSTDKSADKIGFFGAAPVVQPTTYTLTYSTGNKTLAAPTAATLTVADGAGTNDNTIGAITDNTTTIAAVQELADEINKLVADHLDNKQMLASLIADLKLLGLVA